MTLPEPNQATLKKIADMIALRIEATQKLKDLTAAHESLQVNHSNAVEQHEEAKRAVDNCYSSLRGVQNRVQNGSATQGDVRVAERELAKAIEAEKQRQAFVDQSKRVVDDYFINYVRQKSGVIVSTDRGAYAAGYEHEFQQFGDHARLLVLRLYAARALSGDQLMMDFEQWFYRDLLQLPSQQNKQHGVREAALDLFANEMKALYQDGEVLK
jgi:hypothetical protein